MPKPVVSAPKVVRIAITVAMDCGCICDYTIKGHPSVIGWRPNPCAKHNEHRHELELTASKTIKALGKEFEEFEQEPVHG